MAKAASYIIKYSKFWLTTTTLVGTQIKVQVSWKIWTGLDVILPTHNTFPLPTHSPRGIMNFHLLMFAWPLRRKTLESAGRGNSKLVRMEKERKDPKSQRVRLWLSSPSDSFIQRVLWYPYFMDWRSMMHYPSSSLPLDAWQRVYQNCHRSKNPHTLQRKQPFLPLSKYNTSLC